MCSQYWTLKEVKFTCPSCGAETEDDLQTHFMGDIGSCMNYYVINERVPELGTVTVRLPDAGDDFIGGCQECDTYIDFGARIESGAVIGVWPYQWHEMGSTETHTVAPPA